MTNGAARLDFIDALRGLAILLVILVHASLAAPPANATLQAVMAGGARGVQLFYIASAVTLWMSWHTRAAHERSPVRNFYLRRLFRIVPMFYIAMVVYLLLYGFEPRFWAPNGLRWHYVPLTALFLNGFHPETVTSVVPGGWSIVVEMTFYLVLPLLLVYVRGIASLIVLVIVSLALERATGYVFRQIYLPMYPPEQHYLVDNFVFLNFFGQFPVFAIGLLAYRVMKSGTSARRIVVSVAPAVFFAWLTWRAMNGHAVVSVLPLHVQMGAVFAWLAIVLSDYPVRLLINPVTILVGKLSFSMYLSHFAVLDFFAAIGFSAWFGRGNGAAVLHYLCAVAATAAISWVTYRLIERPAIERGRRLIERLESEGATAAVVRSRAAHE